MRDTRASAEVAGMIALAHAECARSQVVSTGAPAPPATPGTAALTGVLPGMARMVATGSGYSPRHVRLHLPGSR
jgi:hypothetical protein